MQAFSQTFIEPRFYLGNEGKGGKNLSSQTWPGSSRRRRSSPRYPRPPEPLFDFCICPLLLAFVCILGPLSKSLKSALVWACACLFACLQFAFVHTPLLLLHPLSGGTLILSSIFSSVRAYGVLSMLISLLDVWPKGPNWLRSPQATSSLLGSSCHPRKRRDPQHMVLQHNRPHTEWLSHLHFGNIFREFQLSEKVPPQLFRSARCYSSQGLGISQNEKGSR